MPSNGIRLGARLPTASRTPAELLRGTDDASVAMEPEKQQQHQRRLINKLPLVTNRTKKVPQYTGGQGLMCTNYTHD